MKVSYEISKKVEGTLDEVLAKVEGVPVTLDEVLKVLEDLTFVAETVAHTHKLERAILPKTDKARAILKLLGKE